MAFRWASDILGKRRPLAVDLTSSMAELSGVEPSLLMATWPDRFMPDARNRRNNRFFMTLILYKDRLILNKSVDLFIKNDCNQYDLPTYKTDQGAGLIYRTDKWERN